MKMVVINQGTNINLDARISLDAQRYWKFQEKEVAL